jgi:hypothetical protein
MQSIKNPNQAFCIITNIQYPSISRVYHTARLHTPKLMRAYRKLQANIYEKYQTNSRKMQERISKSRFRAQGIEAETNV